MTVPFSERFLEVLRFLGDEINGRVKEDSEEIGELELDKSLLSYSLLRVALENGDPYICLEKLKILHDLELCSQSFSLKTLGTILDMKPSELIHNEILEWLKNKRTHSLHHQEMDLMRIVYLLNAHRLQKVIEELQSTKGKVKKPTEPYYNALGPSLSIALLLSGYRAALDYKCSRKKKRDTSVLLNSLDNIYEQKCFFTPFSELYMSVLLKMRGNDATESFLRRYAREQMIENGIIAPVQALAFAQSHMPENRELLVFLLELAVQNDGSNSLVLDLCLTHLPNWKPPPGPSGTRTVVELSSADEGNENLTKCLSLVTDYLDTNADDRRAWSILAETLRRMCTKVKDEYLESMFNAWHGYRREWWPARSFNERSKDSLSISEYADRAVVCAVFEGVEHPFVRPKNTNRLKLSIEDLKSGRKHYDAYVKKRFRYLPPKSNETEFNACIAWPPVKKMQDPRDSEDWSVETAEKASEYRALLQKPANTAKTKNRKRKTTDDDTEEDTRPHKRKTVKRQRKTNSIDDRNALTY